MPEFLITAGIVAGKGDLHQDWPLVWQLEDWDEVAAQELTEAPQGQAGSGEGSSTGVTGRAGLVPG